MTTRTGGALKTLGGLCGLIEILISTSSADALPEPYKTLGHIGRSILTVLSIYSLGCGVNDLELYKK